ncbi:MAG: hypothetical protein GY694_10395 [Gammaproteobacteria bacterium]|nr:hypothetical protein [Gammaproteobacteria bacterium]
MVFSKFYKKLSPAEKKQFAEKINSSVNYLNQLANGHKVAGVKGALKIEKATGGIVTRADILPELFNVPSENTVA